jgi:trigger factor
MEVAVETTEGLERRMTVQVPEPDIAAEVDGRLRDMLRTSSVPGFRPGKVPMKVIVKRYGGRVREEVVGELIQKSFYDAITQEELRPAGGPVIDPLNADPGTGLSYTAVFEVYPELDLASVDGLEVSRPTAEVGDAEVDQMIETLRRQRREFNEVERAAEEGDRVTINFEGSIDGEVFEGGTAEDFPVELGSSGMIDGFDDGILGISVGESKTINVTFPEDYGSENLAGKDAQFAITASKVEAPFLPEVDEEFAKLFGVEDGTMESFRQEIRGNMERELTDVIRTRTKDNVMDALLSSNTVALPKALVTEESERLLEARMNQMRQQGYDPAPLGLTADLMEEEARRRVGLGLLLAEIVRTHSIAPDQDQVRARVDSIASTFEQPQQVVSHYYSERSRLAEIESAVLEDQVVDLLLERAQVTDQIATFDELINRGQTS